VSASKVPIERVGFVIVLVAMIALSGVSVFAQASPSPSPEITPATSDSVEESKNVDDKVPAKKEKRGRFIIAPIPIKSPAFGSGLVLGLGYVFKIDLNDKKSFPSTIGLAGAYLNSGTAGLALGGRLYFDQNRYQTAFAIAKGKANYDFYGIGRIPGTAGIKVAMRQSGSAFLGEFMRNVGKNIFVGPRYQYRKLTASTEGITPPGGFVIPAIDLTSTTSSLGFHIQRDLRDSTFYPRHGSLLDVKTDFFAKALGSNRTYQTFSISYSGYHSLGKKQVLAYQAAGCGVSDTTPFFDLCFYGAKSLIRGYTAGEFQDRRLVASQIEFRQELPYRLGIAAFAGAGGIARRLGDLRFDELLPGAGVGLRFNLDKTNHINYRIDLGFGRNGHTLSFSVTEAF